MYVYSTVSEIADNYCNGSVGGGSFFDFFESICDYSHFQCIIFEDITIM